MTNEFIIICAPRSGSSCLAGILHRLGVNMGDYWAPDHNPPYYPDQRLYEDVDFYQYGVFSYYPVIGLANILKPLILPILDEFPQHKKYEFQDLYKRKCYYNHSIKWGWKHPLTVFYLKHVIHMMDNPIVIHSYRNPIDIGESINRTYDRRDGYDIACGFDDLIGNFFDCCEGRYSDKSTTYEFEKVKADPEGAIKDINKRFNLKANEEQKEAALKHIIPDSTGGEDSDEVM